MKNKRILIMSSVFPPDIIGGAEMSAANLARQLLAQGAEVGVLTTAKTPSEVCEGIIENGIKVWRVWMPRAYPAFYFSKAKFWQKPIWHLQDHFDPRNPTITGRVLDAFKPDIVNIHVLHGLGFNSIRAIIKRNIPFIYFLHDLGLACIKTSMFKKGKNGQAGKECAGQCVPCYASSLYKRTLFSREANISFCSPSRANLEKVARYFPVKRWPNTVIINANTYPAPTLPRQTSDRLRILYVGRLDEPKGVHILLQAAAQAAKNHPIAVTIVGSGPDADSLRAQYGDAQWCQFTGFISQTEISNYMVNSDVLCIPSIWPENLPGVVVHALTLGLPVIGSDKGGIPELIEDGKNGLLVEAGNVAAWQAALEKIAATPMLLDQWRSYATTNAEKFNPDYLAGRFVTMMQNIHTRKRTNE